MTESINSVTTSLSGSISNHNNLILYSQYNSIVRSDGVTRKVKVISGGGSGHEPGHCGYVGYGMLDAAIAGDIFASPSVNSILQTILISAMGREDTEILLIVTNYTGDRLNFGLAAEIAKAKHKIRNIEMLLVNDDCSIDNYAASVGKRGLAGTVLIQKIMGALAEVNHSLEKIYKIADDILQREFLCTMGCSFTVTSNNTLISNIEIGKGVHGEPGVRKINEINDFNVIIDIFCEKFVKKIPCGSSVVVLLNNLGGTSNFIMSSFSGLLNKKLKGLYIIERYYTGAFLTSLSAEGLSVTILSLELHRDLILKALDFEVYIPSNHFKQKPMTGSDCMPSKIIDTPFVITDRTDTHGDQIKLKRKLNENTVRDVLISCCNVLIKNVCYLNSVDKELGDGDTGTTMVKGAMAIMNAIENKSINLSDPAVLFQNISTILQSDMGGTSGALYSIFFQAAASSFVDCVDSADESYKIWFNALKMGNDAIMKYGLANVGDRTMMDPLKAGELSLIISLNSGLSLLNALETLKSVCARAATATTEMLPKSGRSAYSFTEDKSNVVLKFPDPGAVCVSLLIGTLIDCSKKNIPI